MQVYVVTKMHAMLVALMLTAIMPKSCWCSNTLVCFTLHLFALGTVYTRTCLHYSKHVTASFSEIVFDGKAAKQEKRLFLSSAFLYLHQTDSQLCTKVVQQHLTHLTTQGQYNKSAKRMHNCVLHWVLHTFA